jgi:exonuclease SbcC
LLDAQQQLVSDISTSLSKLNDVFNVNSSNELDEKIKKVDQLEKAYQTLQSTLVMKQKERSLLESSLSDTMTTFEGVAEKIKGLEMALENSFIEIVSNLESEIKKNLVSIRGLESKKINLVQQNGRLQTEIERLNQDKNTYDDLTQKFKIHELIANAFSKRGIPNHVIKNQLPIINSEIAKILNGIVNFTVELETDLESNSLDVFINYGDSKRIIELGSGMEKMIASLAIRVALLNVSSLPKTDLFIIDEGFTDLDESGIEACNRLICSLKKYFKNLLIITHIEAVKETIDNLIEITRTEHDSKVTYE